MKYREDKKGEKLSVLGFGCMRFKKKGGQIDIDEAEKEILRAYELGVNYFDTAYIYGGSEAAIGEIFERNNMRDKIKLTTKLPQYLVTSNAALDKYFNEQLKRLRTDYVDYYLMHHLTDIAMWEKLKSCGVIEWLNEKRKSGAIRNVGFSYHGNTDNFLKILDDYDWDICQVQYNYYDEFSQAGREGVLAAEKKGIPVVIMEPLRGGKLVNLLPESAKQVIRESERNWTPAEWGFRWLYDKSGVTVVLSGMNDLDMVEENCRVASSADVGSFTESDLQTIKRINEKIKEVEKVGCTGCRYCMPCPKGVDIPGTFLSYNIMYTESKSAGRHQFVQTVGLTKDKGFASQCVECGKCETHCPQNIEIRKMLKEADKALRPWHYKLAIDVMRKYMYHARGKKS